MSRLPLVVDRLRASDRLTVPDVTITRVRPWVPRRWMRRHRIASLALALAAVAVLGTDVYLLSQRNVTTTVSFGAALRSFRSQAGTVAAVDGSSAAVQLGAASSPSGATPDTPSPVTAGAVASTATTSGPHAAVVTPPDKAAPAAVVSPAAAAPFVLPPDGVYRYQTTGGEQVSILGASHKYPSETYASVHRGSGCQWGMEFDVVQEHIDRRTQCSQSGSLLQLDQSRSVSFFGVTQASDYTFTPAQLMVQVGEAAGSGRDSFCSGSMGTAKLRVTDLGHQTVMIGGQTVDIVHVVVDGVLSGKARGKTHDDQLVDAKTGMIVSWSRWVDSYADTSFGTNVHYTEQASFVLESMIPTT